MEEPSDLWGLLVVDIDFLRSNGYGCRSLAAWSTGLGRNDPVPVKRALKNITSWTFPKIKGWQSLSWHRQTQVWARICFPVTTPQAVLRPGFCPHLRLQGQPLPSSVSQFVLNNHTKLAHMPACI